MHGAIDEVRISNSARPADWIATEYNNQNSPATFYTIYPENATLVAPANTVLSRLPVAAVHGDLHGQRRRPSAHLAGRGANTLAGGVAGGERQSGLPVATTTRFP